MKPGAERIRFVLTRVTRRRLRASLGAALLCLSTGASAYPTKPIRIIHPYAPGGGTETQARAVGQYLSEAWGQPVVVDGRPGAGGAVGTQIVARSAPDGYTLLLTNAAFATSSVLSAKPLFDPLRDFSPVVHIGTAPSILVAHPALPSTLKDFLAHVRANPGKLHYGSSGTGAGSHLAMEYLMSMAGIDMVHVPYRGSAPAAIALVAGEVQVAIFSGSSVLPHIRSGKMRALGVTSTRRSETLPEVPPLSEIGVPGYAVLQWSGVLAPAGTPKPLISQLNQKINEALQSRQVREQLAKIDVEPAGGTSEHFAAFVRSEVAKWTKVIRQGGIRGD